MKNTRTSFTSLTIVSLRLQAKQQQAVKFTLLEQCRYTITWDNLNYILGCAIVLVLLVDSDSHSGFYRFFSFPNYFSNLSKIKFS